MDLSVVVNLHREGVWAVPCLGSLKQAVSLAEHRGLEVETLVVMDRSDEETVAVALDLIDSWRSPVRAINIDAGDLATARNVGVSASSGRYVAFADGDDLYSANWLYAAVKQADCAPEGEGMVVHPAAAFFFGADYRLFWSADSADLMQLGIDGLLRDNFWISTMLTSRALLIEAPLLPRNVGRYGFEDWSWYLDREADGVSHRIARGTVHCVRLKPPRRSLNKASAKLGERPHPNRFVAELLRRVELTSDGPGVTVLSENSAQAAPTKRRRRLRLRRRGQLEASAENREASGGARIVAANGATMVSWDEQAYLRENPDVKAAIEDGVFRSGFEHYSQYGWHEGRRAFMQGDIDDQSRAEKSPCAELSTETMVPQWMAAELDRLAKYEPLLSRDLRRAPWLWNPHQWSGNHDGLSEIARGLRGVEALILVPFLGIGGADLAATQLAEGVAECGLSVAVMSTEGSVTPDRRSALESRGIRVLGDAQEWRERLGARVLAEILATSEVGWVHVLNSALGWDAIPDIRALTSACVTVSLFCYDFLPSGKPVGYLARLPEIAQDVAAVVTDNGALAPFIHDSLGLGEVEVVKLRHRIIPGRSFAGPLRSGTVLWAGRLDRQKNLARLLAVARLLPDLRFHVYGSSVTDGTQLSTVGWPNNVEYCGPFDGFSSIPRDYGVFLYTSLWDGLPNILIEAAQCKIPIVAPRVGGIGLDLPERWIAIYPSSASPGQIARLVDQVLERPAEWDHRAAQLQAYATEEHSSRAALSDIRGLLSLLTVSVGRC